MSRFLCIILISILSVSAHSRECPIKSEQLDHIKTYFTCVQSPLLGACGTLGAYVAGRKLSKPLLEKVASSFKKQESQYINSLASKLHDEWREPRRITDLKKYEEGLKAELRAIDRRVNTLAKNAESGRMLPSTGPSMEDVAAENKKLEAEAKEISRQLKYARAAQATERERLVAALKEIDSEIREEVKDLQQARTRSSDQYRDADRAKERLQALKQQSEEIKNRLKNGGRALDATAIYEPRVKVVNGKEVDIANTNYRELPEQFKIENRESAKVNYQQILKALEKGEALDKAFIERTSRIMHDEWVKRNKEWAPPEQKLPFDKLSKVEADKDRVMVRKGIDHFVSHQSLAAKGAHKLATKGVYSAGRILAGLAAGTMAAADFALLVLATEGNVGCGDLESEYLNSQMNKCGEPGEPVLTAGVYRFLNSATRAQQASFLENSDNCLFYQTLYNNTFKDKLDSVNCSGRNLTYTYKNRIHDKKHKKIINLRENGTVQNIQSFFPGDITLTTEYAESGKEVRTKTTGDVKDSDLPMLQSSAAADKLYTQEIVNCCSSSDKERVSCLSELNKSSSEPIFQGFERKNGGQR